MKEKPESELRHPTNSLFFYLGGSAIILLCIPALMFADTNLISPDEIPPLRPPRPELPPSFWEQYGVWVVCGGILLAVVLGVIVWLITRPKPPVPIPPAVEARRALEPLQGRPEDGAVVSRVSQVLRQYVVGAFNLPPGELTTTEFCRALIPLDRMGPPLSVPLTDFLRECDRRKFAPDPPMTPALGAVSRAMRFIEQCEARLAQLRQVANLTRPHVG